MDRAPRDVDAPVMVAVFNHKGGVAKTTTACNLAVCLAAHGYRVVLVDLDTQGNATGSFGVSPLPAKGAYEVMTGHAPLDEALIPTPYAGLSLLPATTSLRAAEIDLATGARKQGLLSARLARGGLGRMADIVVVDCPPALASLTTNALASADAVLMPVRPDPFAHDGLVNTWYEIRRIRQGVNAGLGVAGILLTMTASEPAGDDVSRVIRAEFGAQVWDVEIATDTKVAEAAQLSMPVCVLDPDGLSGSAYLAAAGELLRRLGRRNRPGAALPRARSCVEALNTLREWRATVHAALLRTPGTRAVWTGPPGSGEEDGEAGSPSRGRGLRWPLVLTLALGLATGMVVEALTGLVRGWL